MKIIFHALKNFFHALKNFFHALKIFCQALPFLLKIMEENLCALSVYFVA